MKQKDIALIIGIAFVSAIASFIISGKIFVTTDNKQQKVEVVDVINTQFSQPDSKYFNSQGVDPAQPIQLGGNNNQNPFNGASQ
jgi:hypothetical protein